MNGKQGFGWFINKETEKSHGNGKNWIGFGNATDRYAGSYDESDRIIAYLPT